jgi:hypothetical protein
MADVVYKSPLGVSIYDDKESYDCFSITGNPKEKETIVEFDSAYDFEEFIQKHINCKGIEFDSEFCQFFAYAKTRERALKFVNDIEKHFEKVKKMLD